MDTISAANSLGLIHLFLRQTGDTERLEAFEELVNKHKPVLGFELSPAELLSTEPAYDIEQELSAELRHLKARAQNKLGYVNKLIAVAEGHGSGSGPVIPASVPAPDSAPASALTPELAQVSTPVPAPVTETDETPVALDPSPPAASPASSAVSPLPAHPASESEPEAEEPEAEEPEAEDSEAEDSEAEEPSAEEPAAEEPEAEEPEAEEPEAEEPEAEEPEAEEPEAEEPENNSAQESEEETEEPTLNEPDKKPEKSVAPTKRSTKTRPKASPSRRSRRLNGVPSSPPPVPSVPPSPEPLRRSKRSIVQKANVQRPPPKKKVQRKKPVEIWCNCREPSYGDMIGCDNDKCKIEWFHYKCVGIRNPAPAEWVCRDCLKQMGMTIQQYRRRKR